MGYLQVRHYRIAFKHNFLLFVSLIKVEASRLYSHQFICCLMFQNPSPNPGPNHNPKYSSCSSKFYGKGSCGWAASFL